MAKKLKFRIKNQDDHFYQELRKQAAKYLDNQPNGRFANGKMWGKAVLYLTLYWGAYAGIFLLSESSIAVMTLYALLGVFGLFVAFNISHDAAHGTWSASPAVNKLIYYCTMNPLGTDAYLWRMRHVYSHHLFPNVDGVDADIDQNYLVRLSPNRPLLPHHRWQHLYAPLLYLFYTIYWVLIKDWQYLFRKNLANLHDIRHPKGEVAGVVISKLFYFSYLIVLPIFMGVAWKTVLAGFLLLHIVMSYFFLFTNIMNHHADEPAFPRQDAEGYLPGSWAQHQITTCLDFHPLSKSWNFFFGGFNSHCAHHLFPEVSHIHYPEISKMILSLVVKYSVPYQQSTWTHGLRSHFHHLKTLGSQYSIETGRAAG